MKLKNLMVDNFEIARLRKLKDEYFQILDNHLNYLFLGKAFAHQNIQELKRDDKKITRIYNDRYLPFHTRDNDWLVKFINKKYNNDLKTINNLTKRGVAAEKIKYVPVDYIQAYVGKSSRFEHKRREYEGNLVGAYLDIGMSSRENDFYANVETKKEEQKNANFDFLFRNRVVNAMKYLGLKDNTIESAIESKADLWRDKARKLAFVNTFNKRRIMLKQQDRAFLEKHNPQAVRKLRIAENTLFKTWNALRDMKYYKQHKAVIDGMKIATPYMRINAELEYKLTVNTQKLGYHYQKQIIDCNIFLNQLKAEQTQKISC